MALLSTAPSKAMPLRPLRLVAGAAAGLALGVAFDFAAACVRRPGPPRRGPPPRDPAAPAGAPAPGQPE